MNKEIFTAFIFASLLGGFLALVLVAFVVVYDNLSMSFDFEMEKVQLERERHRAEVHALHAQIEPHFLFNTLGFLAALVRLGRQVDALNAITAFSRHLRYKYKTPELVSLSEELDYLQHYVTLQSFRFRDRFSVRLDVPDVLRYRFVPSFTLQPFLENYFKYVVENQSSPTVIHIHAEQQDECHWRLKIQDDGPGFSEEALRSFDDRRNSYDGTGDHMGVLNVHRRLRLLFGEDGGVCLKNHPLGGAVVECRFGIETRSFL